MADTLVDSSVLVDLLDEDEEWLDWSSAMLDLCAARGRLCINPIIYAEASVRFARAEEVDEALPPAWLTRLDLPWPAAFLAGKAYYDCRRRGGTRRSPLADFYIGAHAAVSQLDLLTRDPQRYRRYFPTVRVIAP